MCVYGSFSCFQGALERERRENLRNLRALNYMKKERGHKNTVASVVPAWIPSCSTVVFSDCATSTHVASHSHIGAC